MDAIPNVVTVDLAESRDAAAQGGVAAAANGLLDALDRAKTTATFFLSRPVAEGNPSLARQIHERGHEVACLTTRPPAASKPYCPELCAELEATRDALEQATGARVRGHRNATFAVTQESEWLYDVLLDRGFEYDSSRFPRKYVYHGEPPVPRGAHAVRRWSGTLLEIPVSTADVLTMRVQVGTTAAVRGLPLPVWSALIEDRRARGEPLVMHLRASELRRAKTIERVGRIAGRFPFTSVANALPALLRRAPIVES